MNALHKLDSQKKKTEGFSKFPEYYDLATGVLTPE